MSRLRTLFHRLAGLVRRRRAEAGLDDEIQTHLSLLEAEHERRGMTPAAAQDAARRDFGGIEQMKEIHRDRRGIPWVEGLVQDVRYALRTLRRSPGFTPVAVLTLALGIGANGAFFSVLDALILRKLPVDRPDELVVFTSRDDRPGANAIFSYPLWQDFRAAGGLFTGIAASGGTLRRQMTVAAANGTSDSEAIVVEAVSGNFFQVMGVSAALGRTLVNDDDIAGRSQPVVVLSHRLWQRRFDGSPDVLGRRVTIDGMPFTVVGVAAEQFTGIRVEEAPDAWGPLLMTEATSPASLARLTQRTTEWLLLVGRLKPDSDVRAAQAQMTVLFRRDLEQALARRASVPGRGVSAAEREAILGQRLELVAGATGWSDLRERFTRPLLVLMVGVGVVLLIACANIANLLMARAAVRRREMIVRLAIGAGRRRLIRQLVTESLVLSLIGGVAGLAVAVWVSQLLVSFVPTDVVLQARLDARVILFTLGVATIAGLVFGLGPAFFGTAVEEAVVAGTRATASRRTAVTNALVVSQVALCVVVLLGAGLFLRTVRNLQNVELGFQQEQFAVFRLAAPPAADTARRTATYREIARRLREQPGVTGASFSLFGMLSNNNRTQRVSIPGYAPSADESMSIRVSHIERSFFDVTGIRIVDGRPFDSGDEASGRRVAIIDRTMATRYFGGRALGKRFALLGPSGPEEDSLEVIGVAADAKYRNVREEPFPTVYALVGERGASSPVPALVEVRTSPSASLGEQTIMRIVRDVEPAAMVTNVATMAQVVDRAMAQERLLSTVASLFGTLALVVAAIGLYGVRSFAIASRTKEIGVRLALGASPMMILRSLLGQGIALVIAGVGLGTGAALLLTRPIEGFLYQVRPNDPATFAAVATVLGLSTLLASYLPAHRATRIDPVAPLRSE